MAARSTKHPFTGALYVLQADGNVEVTDGGQRSLFSPEGRWLSGELRECDPQLCVWIANNPELAVDSDSHLAQASSSRRPMPKQ